VSHIISMHDFIAIVGNVTLVALLWHYGVRRIV